ncbi:hypothetical protein J2Z21_002902 [Streptomyces griseochromogenes]|uniref:Uncharacterized protein n=1 Tax=Streptomyces griseochromogenes TaxID=68214 RepID=A0ABS4LS30_9ACTN|nr:hypothetical protein [Streptomyces griseochromogenes]
MCPPLQPPYAGHTLDDGTDEWSRPGSDRADRA